MLLACSIKDNFLGFSSSIVSSYCLNSIGIKKGSSSFKIIALFLDLLKIILYYQLQVSEELTKLKKIFGKKSWYLILHYQHTLHWPGPNQLCTFNLGKSAWIPETCTLFYLCTYYQSTTYVIICIFRLIKE